MSLRPNSAKALLPFGPTMCAAIALGFAVSGGAAHAQEADNETAEAGDTTIIVTGRRREENLQEVPLSITALDDVQIEERGVTGLLGLDTFVPNLSLGGGDNTGGSNIVGVSIRGVGDTQSRLNIDGAVGLYIDDVFVPRLTGTLFDLLDVESIEVLRGPQGTLFGRNTTGGAVRYNSKKPETGVFEGYVKAGYGSFDRIDLTGLVNVPLGDSAAVRVSTFYRERDGYVDNFLGTFDTATNTLVDTGVQDLGNDENFGIRGAFRFEPSADITIDLTGAYIQDKGNGPPIKVTAWNLDAGAGRGEPSRILRSVGLRTTDPEAAQIFQVLDGRNTRGGVANSEDITTEFLSAEINWNLSENLTLTSRTAYLNIETLIENDNDYTPIIYRERVRQTTSDSWSQELLLSGDYDRFDFTAGLYYFEETPTEITRGSDRGVPDLFLGQEDLDASSFAIFGEGTFDITDALNLTLGYRYTEDDKTLVADAGGPIRSRDRNFVPDPNDPPAPNGASGSAKFDASTVRATLQYFITDDINVFATYSTGFRSGGFNNDLDLSFGPENNYGVQGFDPEKLDNYEIGFRSTFADGTVVLNATAYKQDWKDRQLRVTTPEGLRITRNAGDASSQGFEADLSVYATNNFALTASIGTIDAEWERVDPLLANDILIDSEFARTPSFSFSLGARHEYDFDNGGSISSSVNYGYRGDQNTSFLQSRTIPIEGYGLVSGRIQYNAPSGNWGISLACTNCFDEDYIVSGGDFTGLTAEQASVGNTGRDGFRFEQLGRPAEWFLEAKFNF